MGNSSGSFYRTYLSGCEARIKCIADRSDEYLEVYSMEEKHNHPTTKALYEHLPRNRALPKNVRDEARRRLALLTRSMSRSSLNNRQDRTDCAAERPQQILSQVRNQLCAMTFSRLLQHSNKNMALTCHILEREFQGLLISTENEKNNGSLSRVLGC